MFDGMMCEGGDEEIARMKSMICRPIVDQEERDDVDVDDTNICIMR